MFLSFETDRCPEETRPDKTQSRQLDRGDDRSSKDITHQYLEKNDQNREKGEGNQEDPDQTVCQLAQSAQE